MSLITKPFFLVVSAFYRFGYKLHHKLFLRPQPQLHIPVIIVGSYLTGGAGKTPFTLWLAKQFIRQSKKIAILCHNAAWDEFILLQRELQTETTAKVFATGNRYKTAKQIQDKFDIILCDDGFEDSRFTGAKRICLDWQEPPQKTSSLWPAGPFRSLMQDHDEREIIHLDCNRKHDFRPGKKTPDVQFYIELLTNYIHRQTLQATIVCGLGAPRRFIEDIRAFGVDIEKSIIRPDHDKRFLQIVQAELSQGKDIVITQKDACRLPQPILAHPKLHIAIQKITVSDNATKRIAAGLS